MGINLSRGKPIKYYSSDRIAQLIGNGLLTFIDEKTYLGDFFDKNEIVFYKDINDLSYKINKYKKDIKNGKQIARLGKKKYFKYFNSTIVSDYIISKTFEQRSENKFLWEKNNKMFSIIIPTLNNVKYLELCIKSIIKNSKYNHEIIPHVNIGTDGTIEYLKKNNLEFTYTKENAGICKGMNLAAKKSNNDYILYAHDDFYFCPDWDVVLKKIDLIGHNMFYLSGTMMHKGQIDFDCGDTVENFDEKNFCKILKNIIIIIFKDQLGHHI